MFYKNTKGSGIISGDGMKRKIKYILEGFFCAVILFGIIKGTVFYRNYKIEQSLTDIEQTQSLFSYEKLISKAKVLSELAYSAPGKELPKELQEINYDEYRSIRFKREKGPWYGGHKSFEVQFFHAGGLFQNSVKINEVIGQKSYPLKYSSDFFNFGHNRFTLEHLTDIGYAGFRLHFPLNTDDYFDELISFLGASYFRALGEGQKYGISARGLAIDTAVSTGEEFPFFKEFWLQRPRWYDNTAVIYALLDSPSITGAYKFTVTPGKETIIEVESHLFPRKDINKLGIAPLTSMYLFGENTKNRFDDFRPEVHDSDGLLIANAKGEWLWRPLDNSKNLRISDFADENPKGFGLLQRDRDLSHYLDFEAHYDQRPSVWVEPIGDWGKGVVELVEAGVITNAKKNFHPGKSVVTFLMGTQKLYDFVDKNPMVELKTVDYVNHPIVVAENSKLVCINSALQVDFLGQVVSDSIGTRQFSGVGGQVDFMRGAAMAKDGKAKAIIAMPSVTVKKDGTMISKIVPFIDEGAAVTATRHDADYIITEYGIAHLKGKTLKERARALVEIAHPKFREGLKRQFETRFNCEY